MKPRKLKTCRNKGCTKVFKPFKSTEKYCSSACFYENAPKPKPRTPIKPVSEKAKGLNLKYRSKRRKFMFKKENKICPVSLYFMNDKTLTAEEQLDWSRNLKTTEVHHKAGRVGKLLLYVPYWLAVSRKGHTFIHDNPEFSHQKGWLIKSTTV